MTPLEKELLDILNSLIYKDGEYWCVAAHDDQDITGWLSDEVKEALAKESKQ